MRTVYAYEKVFWKDGIQEPYINVVFISDVLLLNEYTAAHAAIEFP